MNVVAWRPLGTCVIWWAFISMKVRFSKKLLKTTFSQNQSPPSDITSESTRHSISSSTSHHSESSFLTLIAQARNGKWKTFSSRSMLIDVRLSRLEIDTKLLSLVIDRATSRNEEMKIWRKELSIRFDICWSRWKSHSGQLWWPIRSD